jgi:hypothetical protein
MDFKNYDELIESLARRYAGNLRQIEYLESVGRVTVAMELESERGTPEKRLREVLESKFTALTAKRRDLREEKSLVAFTSSDSEVREMIADLLKKIKVKHGKQYARSIKDENDPAETVSSIFRSVICEVHKIRVEDIPRRVNYSFFRENGLERLLWVFYRNSPFKAIKDAFPGEFVPWDFWKKPNGFWKGKRGQQRALDAVEWFIEKKEIKSIEDCGDVLYEDFKKEHLGAMLHLHFDDSIYLALKSIFPALKPWQMNRAYNGYYNNENNCREALLGYLMESGVPSILQLNPEQVYETGLRTFVSRKDMCDNGFRGLFRPYEGSIYRMFTSLLPDKILPWTLNNVKEPWKVDPEETAARAIRWLFDDYLKIDESEISDYATCDLFWRVGFSGILTNRQVGYNSSPYAAVNSAYPGKFSREDFKRSRWERSPRIETPSLIRTQKRKKK